MIGEGCYEEFLAFCDGLASNWNNSANGGYAGMKAMVLWSNAQGTNNSGFSAVGAGWRTNKNIFDALFNEARFAYPVEDDKPEWTADGCCYGVLAKISTSSSLYDHGYKAAGNSVRCVKNY